MTLATWADTDVRVLNIIHVPYLFYTYDWF